MHGTHVAALCLGTADNSRGVSGVAPSCKLMPIKVGDDAGNIALTYIIDGVLFAIKNGARVINISIGADLSSLTYAPYEVQEQIAKTSSIDEGEFWNELFKLAESKNITIVLAAGNDHVLSNIDPMKRSSNVIIVGASDKIIALQILVISDPMLVCLLQVKKFIALLMEINLKNWMEQYV
ncbi:MAG: S8 family serine peptidase [Saprospiraceae bacterium]|nr:S8 family serine peptidase [Saprospiraceae bacterium]